jgi:hypothetical protein
MLARRDLPRLMVITCRPREVPAFREMHGELAGDLPRALTVPVLQSLTRPQVEPYPVPEGDARIEYALVHAHSFSASIRIAGASAVRDGFMPCPLPCPSMIP